jgi:DNA-binding FadR family transcriptional regulator
MVYSAYLGHGGAAIQTENEVRTRTRVSELVELLRSRIQGGELAPGDRLPPEREFAPQLGVARPTLRLALKALHDEGFLHTRRGATGGTFVSELDLPMDLWFLYIQSHMDEFEDILDFRQAVETHAAALAAARRDDDDLAAMEQTLITVREAESRPVFRRADSLFHSHVAQASGSPRLERAIRQARGELFFPTDKVYFVDQMELSYHDHRAIFEAIRDWDGQKAARHMAVHIEHAREQLHRIFLRM